MPPNGKSILQTADPYHTPGYCGYVPQYKYRIGNTYGKTTHKLFVDDTVPSSGSLVLTDIYKEGGDVALLGKKSSNVAGRDASWGDQKYTDKMVPGYTGFIPKAQHYFGKRYAEGCLNSISDFQDDQKTQTSKQRSIDAAHLPPMQQTAKDMAPYLSPSSQVVYWKSPYKMDNSEKLKYFMSGYTGFVPRTRPIIGMGYPIKTNVGLNTFTDTTRAHDALRGTAVTNLSPPEVVMATTRPIYPKEAGMIPNYTGHVPGYKFRFGHTYGQGTVAATPGRPEVAA